MRKPNFTGRPVDWSFGSWTLGVERSTVRLHGESYLTRYILKLFGWTLRLHRFHRGDDDRAFHDHPWPFWTFPFTTYYEYTPYAFGPQEVRGWRLHYRPAEYQHIVCEPRKPFWTFVLTKPYERSWGFWPTPDTFVPWRDWK